MDQAYSIQLSLTREIIQNYEKEGLLFGAKSMEWRWSCMKRRERKQKEKIDKGHSDIVHMYAKGGIPFNGHIAAHNELYKGK